METLAESRRLPVTRLKIDRSFVQDLGRTRQGTAIVSAIVSLARNLELEVVAEGIEHDDQRERLLSIGCEAGQGYLFGKPMSGAELLWCQMRSGPRDEG